MEGGKRNESRVAGLEGGRVITANLAFHRARRSSPGKDVKSVDGEL